MIKELETTFMLKSFDGDTKSYNGVTVWDYEILNPWECSRGRTRPLFFRISLYYARSYLITTSCNRWGWKTKDKW